MTQKGPKRLIESVGVLAYAGREAAVECAGNLARFLEGRGVPVRFRQDLAAALGCPDRGAPDEALGAASLLVALGGDGTLLTANRVASPHGTPILGVHVGGTGSFGFLTVTTPAEATSVLASVLDGNYEIDERLMVAAEVRREGTVVDTRSALNEIVLRSRLRMLKLRIEVEGTFIATYAADGIIVATPVGSTAYNLAAGGPLVHPAVETILLTPICPHTLNVRSLLVPVNHTIDVTLEGNQADETLLTVDGQETRALQPGDTVRFSRGEQRARFVVVDGPEFYKKVHTRLRLGERF